MNVSWATLAFAQQICIHIAEAGTAKSGPSINTYKEGLRHKYGKGCRMMVNAAITTGQRRSRVSQRPKSSTPTACLVTAQLPRQPNVRYWHLADVSRAHRDARFWSESGH